MKEQLKELKDYFKLPIVFAHNVKIDIDTKQYISTINIEDDDNVFHQMTFLFNKNEHFVEIRDIIVKTFKQQPEN